MASQTIGGRLCGDRGMKSCAARGKFADGVAGIAVRDIADGRGRVEHLHRQLDAVLLSGSGYDISRFRDLNWIDRPVGPCEQRVVTIDEAARR